MSASLINNQNNKNTNVSSRIITLSKYILPLAAASIGRSDGKLCLKYFSKHHHRRNPDLRLSGIKKKLQFLYWNALLTHI